VKSTVSSKESSTKFRRTASFAGAALLAACSHTATALPPHFSHALVGGSWSVADRRKLDARIEAALKPLDGRAAESAVVFAARGAPLFQKNAARALAPASTLKLIVASTSLHELGLRYRFHTRLAAAGLEPGGIVPGDVYLIGSGDPLLTSNDLRGGVKTLWNDGVRQIDGGVVVDATALRGPERNAFWDATDAFEDYSSATSAVSLDQDTIELHVRPTQVGAPARVFLEPPTSAVQHDDDVLTGPEGSWTDITILPKIAPNAFAVSGRVASGPHDAIYYLNVSNVPLYVADVLELMLEARGIAPRDAPRIGIAPQGTHALWEHPSPPLHEIVRKMLYESNNHAAEQLLRTLGRLHGGAGDDRSGLDAERRFLAGQGVPAGGMRIVDGSGLSDTNRVSATTLATILVRAETWSSGNPLYLALPQGGKEGTLRNYPFSGALGRVRAKSGHISGVSALAGYVTTHQHGRIAFAIIVNSEVPNVDADRSIVQAVDAMADF